MTHRAPPRVLFVDDDHAIHRTVVKLLAAFEVCSAYDGPSALIEVETALALRAEFALVILDMNLPRVDGLGVLQHIAERGTFVPVVAMSALAPNLAAAKVRGAREALLKPFEVERLLEVVARICPPQSG